MGLDTTHNAWHGSYSGFNAFRKHLAAKIGIDLDKMEGFTSDGISWEAEGHYIVPLLNHSDCDGHLTPTECKRVADGLSLLLDEEDEWNDRIKQFRDGCLKAYNRGQKLKFQ